MRIIKQLIKDFLHSKYAPDLLSSYYFDRKDKTNRMKLSYLLDQNIDLMEGVNERAREHWAERIDDVLQAEDNADIPRHSAAGTFVDGKLVMHNGIKTDPLSYYSFPMTKMLIDNKGVHEPQEEKVFQEVLKHIAPDAPLTMLELGAYWSFYSMWLLTLFPQARCIMVEPNRKFLHYGKRNFRLNHLKGKFIHAGIGKAKDHALNITTVDEICRKNGIEFIDILHSDIQGFEEEMLQGSEAMLSGNRVGYVFISTHSNELHADCRERLLKYDFKLVADVNKDESYSWDGLLVMKSPQYEGLEHVDVAKKQLS